MTIAKIAAVSTALVVGATMGQATTVVDFEGFAQGQVLGAGTDLGDGILATVTAQGGTDEAVVFLTTAGSISTGNDPDLTSDFTNAEDANDVESFGNVLIVQEDQSGKSNPTTGPDDFVGGMLTFDFTSSLVSLSTVYLLDSAEDTIVSLFLKNALVESFTITAGNESDTNNDDDNNEFTLLDFGGLLGDQLVVDFSESGALGEFTVSAVPVPAGLPLLLGGLGVFAWMKRRKHA